jgi:hypothetical protein
MQQKRKAYAHTLWQFLGKSGRLVMEALGYNRIPEDHNPVWLALAGLNTFTDQELAELVESGEFSPQEAANFRQVQEQGKALAEKLEPILWKRGSKSGILKAHILCQTAILNANQGPVSNGNLGTIRQRWYYSQVAKGMGFKFAAQALEQALVKSADAVLVDDDRAERRAARVRGSGSNIFLKSDKAEVKRLWPTGRIHIWPKSGWGRAYAQMQSQIMAELIREGLLYEQLWVRDASRDTDNFDPLFVGFHGILILEKEGLFDHFRPFSKRTGIPVLLAMAGNNAFSGVEAILNDHFRTWEGEYKPTEENPLHIFCISDYDYAGMVPVQEGAVQQFERYLPWATKLWRVGVTPEQVRATGRSPVQAGYEFEASYNKAYQEWADEYGIWVGETCYAIELDALPPDAFVEDLVNAVVEAAGGDEALKEKLIQAAEPSWWNVQQKIQERLTDELDLAGALEKLRSWTEDKTYAEVSRPVETWTRDQVGERYEDSEWAQETEVQEAIQEAIESEEEGLTVEAFQNFAQGTGWTNGAWRPVSNDAATQAAADIFIEQKEDEIFDYAEEHNEIHEELVEDLGRVFEILAKWGLD